MGRRKIEIQPLTDDRNRTVTFVKRKAGLFKKAHELSVLCQVDLAIIIVGNNNKLYEFSSVDTNELIKAYQTTKPHESKSPANYGNYKKKKNLISQITNDDLSEQEIDDSDYDSDTPEPKRQKRNFDTMKEENPNRMSTRTRPLPPNHISLTNVPTFNSFRNNGVIKEEEPEEEATHFRQDSIATNHSGRPVLRVQIPTDSKSGNDSARTLTALDTNPNPNLNRPGLTDLKNGKSPTINTPKFSSFSTFRSPDTRKPITTLPLPIQSKSQTSSPSSTTAPSLPRDGMTSFFNPLPQPSPTQYQQNVPTPILNQVLSDKFKNAQNQSSSSTNQSHQNSLPGQPIPGQPPSMQQIISNNLPGETPVSGLPSKYVDMFPSPLGFYPQEWSNNITPYSNVNQYFFRSQSQSQNQPPPGSNQVNYQFPSPTQFMNQFEEKNNK
ncbi:hypothetical protein CLIB1444_07S03928 [[Candida] jaroonii]|uniref:Uncharacterized protein n=1 Tax=[Candida] jaroonii TaxID=467808 RepID=A0ACA9YAM2_9ASCO|nr:hypothetical protein CLIB1444_07S03928 [[Candida] jaroonii]